LLGEIGEEQRWRRHKDKLIADGQKRKRVGDGDGDDPKRHSDENSVRPALEQQLSLSDCENSAHRPSAASLNW
jgi:hypothetical protein